MPLSPITRRDWLLTTAASTASLAIPSFTSADQKDNAPIQMLQFPADVEDLPLPMFARYLGSNRFRTDSDIQKLQFSPDGKKLVAKTKHELYVWDYETGRLIARRKTPDEHHRFETIQAQNDYVNAVIVNCESELPSHVKYCHHVRFDIRTLQPLSQLVIPFDFETNYLYHPSGGKLFASHDKSECLYDLEDGHIIGKSQINRYEDKFANLSFSPDGKSVLLSTHSKSKRSLRIIDEPKLGIKLYVVNRKVLDSECWMPDGRILAVHGDHDRFVIIDPKGNTTYASSKLALPNLKLVEITTDQHFAIMSDSYMLRFEPFLNNWLPRIEFGLRTFINPSIAKRVGDRVTAFHYLNSVFFLNPSYSDVLPRSADFSQEVKSIHWGSRNVLTAIGRNFQMMTCHIDCPRQSMVFNRDASWEGYGQVIFSEDGSVAVAKELEWILCFDAKSGEQKIAIQMPDAKVNILRITSDMHYVLGESETDTIWRLDLRNGQIQKLPLVGRLLVIQDRIRIERTQGSKCLVVRKDKSFAELFVIDLEAMKVLWKYYCEYEISDFSAVLYRDGRFVVIFEREESNSQMESSKIVIRETLTGEILRQVQDKKITDEDSFLASNDSRILTVQLDEYFCVFEMATLDERFNIPWRLFQHITVSPDSQWIARNSFLKQYPLELFNLRGEFNPDDPIPENYSLTQAWIDLQSRSAKIGFRAIRYLAKHPEQAIRLFKSNIQHPKMVADKQIQQWIEDLDDNDFKTREAAQNELEQLGRRISKQLKVASENSSSAEVRNRLQSILQSFLLPSIPQIIIERACEVLQWIESSESKALLREWSRGAPQSHLTEEAIETLKVLKRLESDPPTVHTHSPAMPAPNR